MPAHSEPNGSGIKVDARRAPRPRTLKGGRIVFKDGLFNYECVVRNLSTSGACLSLSNSDGVPNRFELHLDDRSPIQICEMVWRTQTKMGVSFEESR